MDRLLPDASIAEQIKRDLETFNRQRLAVHAALRWRRPVFMGAYVAALVIAALVLNSIFPDEQWNSIGHYFLYVGGLICAFFVWVWAEQPATALKQSFRAHLFPQIFSFVDVIGYANGVTPASFAALPRSVVGWFNEQSFDDVLTGTHENFAFELYEADLKYRANKSTTQVFKGVIFHFPIEDSFDGELLITQKTIGVVRFFRDLLAKGGLEGFECGDRALDEAFEFRSTNLPKAKGLLYGDLKEVLKWLAVAHPESTARLAVSSSEAYLLLPTQKNFFELPHIATEVAYDRHILPLIGELGDLLRIATAVRTLRVPR